MRYDPNKRNFDRIPDDMKSARRWVGWVPDKTPIDPTTLSGARSNDSTTWTTFETASASIGRTARYINKGGSLTEAQIVGVGFMLGDGWAGVDLDGGDDHGGGTVDASTLADFVALGSYTEYSKSGEGYHIVGRYIGDKLEGTQSLDKKVEIYTGGRYFAITGNTIEGSGSTAADISDGLRRLHDRYIAEPRRQKVRTTPPSPPSLSPRGTEALSPAGGSPSDEYYRQDTIQHIDEILSLFDAGDLREWQYIGITLKSIGGSLETFDRWSRDGIVSGKSKYGGRRQIERYWDSITRLDDKAHAKLRTKARERGWDSGMRKEDDRVFGWEDEINDTDEPIRDSESEGQPAEDQISATASADQDSSRAASADLTPDNIDSRDRMRSFLKTCKAETYRPIPTGIQEIDNAIGGGLMRKTLVMLGAAPGMGKTALAQWIFESMAQRGTPCVYLNLEMSEDQIIARSLSRMLARQGVKMTPLQVLQGYTWTPDQRAAIYKVAQAYADDIGVNLRYNPPDVWSNIDRILVYLREAASKARKEGRQAPIVCLDYLQIIQGKEREDEAQLIKRIVSSLKGYAMDENTTVVCIMAHNRDSNRGGESTLESGRDTSAIEYSADLQLALDYTVCMSRDGKKGKKSSDVTHDEKKRLTLHITKGRFGGVDGYCDLVFDGASMTFRPSKGGVLGTTEATRI